MTHGRADPEGGKGTTWRPWVTVIHYLSSIVRRVIAFSRPGPGVRVLARSARPQ
jgi:hypothetical protein